MMILTFCIAGVAIASAVSLSYAMESGKVEKVIYFDRKKADIAQEQTNLAQIILNDLHRAIEDKNITGDTIQSAFDGYRLIIGVAWKTRSSQMGQFDHHSYVADAVIPFMELFDSAIILQYSSPTEEFTELLIKIIEDTCPVASAFILRGDVDAGFSDQGYDVKQQFAFFTRKLEEMNKNRLSLNYAGLRKIGQ